MQMKVSAAVPVPVRPLVRATTPDPKGEETPTPPGLLERAQDGLLTGLQDLAFSQRALPKFIFPSVFGTPQEKALIYETLNNLPMHDAVRPITISVRESLGNSNLLGVTRPAINSIDINRTGVGMSNPANFTETVIHEIGHTKDYPGGVVNVLTGGHSSSAPWGSPPHVSRYASTMKQEDFAETYASYRLEPERLQEVSAAKYDEMQRLDQPNAFEVFLDRKEFRETGQYIGNLLSIHPFVRYGLEFASQMAAINLGLTGAITFASGVMEHKTRTAVAGAVDALAGAGLMFSYKNPLIGVAALGFLGARRGLEMAEKRQAGDGATAAAAIAGGLGGAALGVVAPLGLTLLGHSLAGPVGGAIGLVVGGVLGNRLGASIGAGAALGVAGLLPKADPTPAPTSSVFPGLKATLAMPTAA
ncbi:MAG: hypothetical protein AB1758_34515 [Candidatus Eremiobacterota bacterium]